LKRIIFLFLIPLFFACESKTDNKQLIPPLSKEPDFNVLLATLNEEIDNNPTGQNFYLRARLLFKKNQLLESLNDINSSIKIDNTEPKYFLLRAKINYGLKKNTAALRDAENAELQQLRNPDLYTFLTELYISKKQYKKALEEVNKCLDISPYQSSAWLWKGVTTLKIGDTVKGLDFIKKSLLYGPSTNSFYQLGKVYNKLGDFTQAQKYIYDGLKMDSLEANIIYELAENYRLSGKPDTSKYYYLKAIKQNPELYKANFEIGKLFFNEKKYDIALIYFEKIQNKSLEFPQLNELMALSYDYTGKYGKAYDEYTEVINNDLINNGDTTNYKAIERHWQLKRFLDALRYQMKLDSIRLSTQNPLLPN